MRGHQSILLLTYLAFPLAPVAGQVRGLSQRKDAGRALKRRQASNPTEAPTQAPTVSPTIDPFSVPEPEPQITFDFDDNTQGYCLPDYGLINLEFTEMLFTSHVEDVDDFLQFANVGGVEVQVAVDELHDYVQLTRVYLPPETAQTFDDRTILQAVMFAQSEGPERLITAACARDIRDAVTNSLAVFLPLMQIGESVGPLPPLGGIPPEQGPIQENLQAFPSLQGSYLHQFLQDSYLHEPIDDRLALSWVLQQMELQGSFTRFIRTILGYFEAFGEFEFFRDFYILGIKTWEELALTPVSIVSKYASVYLSDGQLLENDFNNLIIDGNPASVRFDFIYDRTIETCMMSDMPSEQPSSSPTMGPQTVNQLLPVVAVVGFTLESKETIRNSWTAFRNNYPNRHFCLLQPLGFDGADLQVPIRFALDPKVIYKQIRYDGGNVFRQSDWFDLCGFEALIDTEITTFPFYIGVNASLVEASLNFYTNMITSRNGEIVEATPIPDPTLNWIDPFNKDFVGGNGGTPSPMSAPPITSPPVSSTPNTNPPITSPPVGIGCNDTLTC